MQTSVDRILDASLSMSDRMAAVQEIVNVGDRLTRHSLLLGVVKRADEDVSASALALLINDSGIPDADVAQQVLTWSPTNQRAILSSIINVTWFERPVGLINFPRALLADARGRDSEVVSAAAIILGLAGEAADVRLLANVVGTRPELGGVWVGISDINDNVLPDELVGLARTTYQREEIEIAARVAAANVIANRDADAKEFVRTTLHEMIKEYADVDIGELILEARLGGADGRARFQKFRLRLMVLGVLRVVDEQVARDITANHYDARNQVIREIVHLVAAMRWPDQWIQLDPMIDEAKYNRMVSLAVLVSPALRERAVQKIGREQLDAGIDMLRSRGIQPAFGFSGGAIVGF